MSPAWMCLGLSALIVCCGDDEGVRDASSATDAGPGDVGSEDATREGRIEVGGGLLAFSPFTGASEMVMGSQGGWHIDVATRFYDIDAIDLELIIEGFDAESGERVTRTVDRLLQERHTMETSPGVRTRVGDRLILDIDDPSEIEGRSIVVRATGLSASGVRAMGEATTVVVDAEP